MCRSKWWEKLRDRVGEIQGEGERDEEREGVEEGGKTNSPRQERIQRGERGSRAARAGRGERVDRERAGSAEEERENHGAFEKVLSCLYARPLRRYRTPVRCCWPRRGRAAFSVTSSE